MSVWNSRPSHRLFFAGFSYLLERLPPFLRRESRGLSLPHAKLPVIQCPKISGSLYCNSLRKTTRRGFTCQVAKDSQSIVPYSGQGGKSVSSTSRSCMRAQFRRFLGLRVAASRGSSSVSPSSSALGLFSRSITPPGAISYADRTGRLRRQCPEMSAMEVQTRSIRAPRVCSLVSIRS